MGLADVSVFMTEGDSRRQGILNKTMMIILGLLVCPITAHAATPKPMINNVATLSEASAALNVCFESSEYKQLSDEQALTLHSLNMRIEAHDSMKFSER